MKQLINIVAVAAALGAAAPALAGGAAPNAQRNVPVATPSPYVEGANAKDQPRLALFYSAGSNVGQSVNVFQLTNPTTGVFCIQPIAKIKGPVFPQVSVEWSTSTGKVFAPFWVDTAYFSDCPKGDYEVRTYDISTAGAPVLTSTASFDFVIQ